MTGIKESDFYTRVEKLAIGYPWSSPFTWTQFTDSIVNLQRPANSRFFRGKGWCPARRHIDLCEKAIAWGASHLLIIGSDQTYPEDMIPRLISRVEKDGCEVITAMVPCRGEVERLDVRPFEKVAWRFKRDISPDRTYRGFETDGDMLERIDPSDGSLQIVDFIGSGVLMFPLSALDHIPKPWFGEMFFIESMNRRAAMDTRFVYELKTKAGLQVWCDTTIGVGHLNTFIIDDTFSDRFADWTEIGYGEPSMKGYER